MRVLEPCALFNVLVLKEQGRWLVMLLILILGQGHRVSVPWILEGSLRRGHDVFWRWEWVGVNQKIVDVKWHARASTNQTIISLGFIICLWLWNLHRRRTETLKVMMVAKNAISSWEVDFGWPTAVSKLTLRDVVIDIKCGTFLRFPV